VIPSKLPLDPPPFPAVSVERRCERESQWREIHECTARGWPMAPAPRPDLGGGRKQHRARKPSESKEVHKDRLALQFQQLSVIQPEVMLLQEVNPLPEMAKAYVAALKGSGLHYNKVHQVDARGVRLAPGLAVVPGLNNGLAVLEGSSAAAEGERTQAQRRVWGLR
jgi:hypothetical protein